MNLHTRTTDKALEEVEEGIVTINPVEDGVITTGITVEDGVTTTGITKEINQTSAIQSNSVDTLHISTYLRTRNISGKIVATIFTLPSILVTKDLDEEMEIIQVAVEEEVMVVDIHTTIEDSCHLKNKSNIIKITHLFPI